MSNQINNLLTIFDNEPQVPFFYNLTFKDVKTNTEIFKKFEELFKTGLVKLFGSQNKLDIRKLTLDNIETIKKYLLSFGIKVIYNVYTNYEKDQYLRCLFVEK